MCRLIRCRTLQLRALAVAAVALCGCGGDSDPSFTSSRVAVLSAFPAELAAYLDRATVSETVILENRVFRIGVLGGISVVMGLTGIGEVNASTTTRTVLEQFDIRGVVVSGVAGSPLQIGDVTVPAAWATEDGTTYAADQQWLERARQIAVSGSVALERCTAVPSVSQQLVCLPQEPAVVVGGVGQSSDPFGAKPFACRPNGGDLYGCDVDGEPAASLASSGRRVSAALASAADAFVANDMETAAIAHEAAAHGVPFIAFRAVSDGAGDPLGLAGSVAQFTAYYHLAARNAAAATLAFLEGVGPGRLGTVTENQ